MGGQCPGAPELKGPPREKERERERERNKKENEEKKKENEEKKKENEEKKKRERNFLNTWTGALIRYIPMSLSR